MRDSLSDGTFNPVPEDTNVENMTNNAKSVLFSIF
jgi:hypothetical protein